MSTVFPLKRSIASLEEGIHSILSENENSATSTSRMQGVPQGLRAPERESAAQALTLLFPSTPFFPPTPTESQIQLGPRNRGDDPRFFLLGLHHHPDSGRLHRVSAGREQVTRPQGWGSCASEGTSEAGGRDDSPAGLELLREVSWFPGTSALGAGTAGVSFQNSAPKRIWARQARRWLPLPLCSG